MFKMYICMSWFTNDYILDPSRKADNGKEEAICVEALKHALNRLSIDSKGDAWSSKIQTAADYII